MKLYTLLAIFLMYTTLFRDFLNIFFLCGFLLQAIKLTFLKLDMETVFDFVEVYDGPNNAAPSLGKFTGRIVPRDITSSNRMLFVYLETDFSRGRSGFKVKYAAIDTGKCAIKSLAVKIQVIKSHKSDLSLEFV